MINFYDIYLACGLFGFINYKRKKKKVKFKGKNKIK